MNRLRFFIVSIILASTLASGFMYFFLFDTNTYGLQDKLHQKTNTDLVSQQYLLEENEFELDEKLTELLRPLFLVLSFLLGSYFLSEYENFTQKFDLGSKNFRPNVFVPIYLSIQVFRN